MFEKWFEYVVHCRSMPLRHLSASFWSSMLWNVVERILHQCDTIGIERPPCHCTLVSFSTTKQGNGISLTFYIRRACRSHMTEFSSCLQQKPTGSSAYLRAMALCVLQSSVMGCSQLVTWTTLTITLPQHPVRIRSMVQHSPSHSTGHSIIQVSRESDLTYQNYRWTQGPSCLYLKRTQMFNQPFFLATLFHQHVMNKLSQWLPWWMKMNYKFSGWQMSSMPSETMIRQTWLFRGQHTLRTCSHLSPNHLLSQLYFPCSETMPIPLQWLSMVWVS